MDTDTTEAPADYSSVAVGWSGFAAIMLIVLGVFDFIQGLVAIVDENFYVVTEEWVFEFDVTVWGWIHVISGVVLVLSGVGIFSGNVLARIVGVLVAASSAIVNFAWLPYTPVWSVIMIAIAVTVIWALTAHGRDITYT